MTKTKTKKMAVIGQRNPNTGNCTHIERRVYADEKGREFVKVSGAFVHLVRYQTSPRYTVDLYY